MKMQHLDTSHRLYLMLLALAILIMLMNSGMAILYSEGSWSARVANTTPYPGVIGAVFVASAMSLGPLIVCLASERCNIRWILKLGTLGAAAGSFSAVGMAYVSRLMELGWFTVFYLALGTLALLVAGSFGAILNHQMKVRCLA